MFVANDNINYIQKIVTLFFKALAKSNIKVNRKERVEVIEKTRDHYISHKEKYELYVKSTDPFKFMAWSSSFLIKIKQNLTKEQKFAILNTAIELMSSFLQCKINEQLIQKLLLMAMHDGIDDEKAIGKNGLYMAFRSTNELCKKTTK